eukprot:jgi/Psemu1/55754/gm1.55754_g
MEPNDGLQETQPGEKPGDTLRAALGGALGVAIEAARWENYEPHLVHREEGHWVRHWEKDWEQHWLQPGDRRGAELGTYKILQHFKLIVMVQSNTLIKWLHHAYNAKYLIHNKEEGTFSCKLEWSYRFFRNNKIPYETAQQELSAFQCRTGENCETSRKTLMRRSRKNYQTSIHKTSPTYVSNRFSVDEFNGKFPKLEDDICSHSFPSIIQSALQKKAVKLLSNECNCGGKGNPDSNGKIMRRCQSHALLQMDVPALLLTEQMICGKLYTCGMRPPGAGIRTHHHLPIGSQPIRRQRTNSLTQADIQQFQLDLAKLVQFTQKFSWVLGELLLGLRYQHIEFLLLRIFFDVVQTLIHSTMFAEILVIIVTTFLHNCSKWRPNHNQHSSQSKSKYRPQILSFKHNIRWPYPSRFLTLSIRLSQRETSFLPKHQRPHPSPTVDDS